MRKKLTVAAVVLLAGVAAWLLYYYSDEQVIKRKLTTMAASVSKEGEESPVTMALKLKPVKDFIAPACEVRVPERNYRQILEPGLVIRYLIMYRSRLADLQVGLDEITVEIPSKGRGEVSALVHVVANRNRADYFDEIHRVTFSVHKEEEAWLLRRAVLPEALVRR